MEEVVWAAWGSLVLIKEIDFSCGLCRQCPWVMLGYLFNFQPNILCIYTLSFGRAFLGNGCSAPLCSGSTSHSAPWVAIPAHRVGLCGAASWQCSGLWAVTNREAFGPRAHRTAPPSTAVCMGRWLLEDGENHAACANGSRHCLSWLSRWLSLVALVYLHASLSLFLSPFCSCASYTLLLLLPLNIYSSSFFLSKKGASIDQLRVELQALTKQNEALRQGVEYTAKVWACWGPCSCIFICPSRTIFIFIYVFRYLRRE